MNVCAKGMKNKLQRGEKTMTIKEKVENALQKVRPSLQADGGDVQLVDVDEDGLVKVKLMGACGGCPCAIQHGAVATKHR